MIDQGFAYQVQYRWQKVANRADKVHNWNSVTIHTSVRSKYCLEPFQTLSSSSLYSSNGTPASSKSSIISFAFLSTTKSRKISSTVGCFLISRTRTSHLPRYSEGEK